MDLDKLEIAIGIRDKKRNASLLAERTIRELDNLCEGCSPYKDLITDCIKRIQERLNTIIENYDNQIKSLK